MRNVVFNAAWKIESVNLIIVVTDLDRKEDSDAEWAEVKSSFINLILTLSRMNENQITMKYLDDKRDEHRITEDAPAGGNLLYTWKQS